MVFRIALAMFACLSVPTGVFAQVAVAPATPTHLERRAEDIVAVLKGELDAKSVFTPVFLAEVSPQNLRQIQSQMEAQFGPLLGVESVTAEAGGDPAVVMFRFERGVAGGPITIETAAPFRVAGLRISNFRAIDDSAQGIAAEVAALPGRTSIYLAPLDNGAPLISYRADTPMAVGSSFKLYVLSALAQSIAAGEHSWSEVVPLTERSLPSGVLQDWPAGTPVTVQTLATLMISISDNTATDQLIKLLGRERLEHELAAAGNSDPSATIPFPTTREMFALKTLDAGTHDRFAAAGDEEQRQIIDALDPGPLSAAEVQRAFGEGPRYLDVEWFASAHDIAALFIRLRECGDPVVLEILGVNKSANAAESGRWSYIGYKGGSEPGVLSLNWLLRNRAGRWYVLSMAWNDPARPVDSGVFELLASRAMAIAPEQ